MVVGKIQRQAQLESFFRKWKNLTESESFTVIGKFARKLESSDFNQYFQLNWKFSNLIENFPFQFKTFELQLKFSNSIENLPTQFKIF